MAAIGGNALTLLDLAKQANDNLAVQEVVEVLAPTNEILDDMLWVQANLPTGHRTTQRTSLPTPSWGRINKGIPFSKSTTKQVTDPIGELTCRSTVDLRLLEIAQTPEDARKMRYNEDMASIQSAGSTVASNVIYGDPDDNEDGFLGLTSRYAIPSTNKRVSGYNMVDGGGSGSDNTSIWLMFWGPKTVHGIYGRNQAAGIRFENNEKVRVEDSDGNPYYAAETIMRWSCGLTVADWRAVVRICNIDVSDLATASPADLIELMIKALHRVPKQVRAMGLRPAFYMNSTVMQYLDIQKIDKALGLSYSDAFGDKVMTFRGIPLREVDELLNDEAAVTGTFAS